MKQKDIGLKRPGVFAITPQKLNLFMAAESV